MEKHECKKDERIKKSLKEEEEKKELEDVKG